MNEERDSERREKGNKPYTVVGECGMPTDDTFETFVDWAWSHSAMGAVEQVTEKRDLARSDIIAVLAGHHVDLLV